MKNKFIVRKDGHVAWLIFDRPDKLNAMDIPGWREFGRLLDEIVELARDLAQVSENALLELAVDLTNVDFGFADRVLRFDQQNFHARFGEGVRVVPMFGLQY